MGEIKKIIECVSFSCPYCYRPMLPPYGILEEDDNVVGCSICLEKISIEGSSFASVCQVVKNLNGRGEKTLKISGDRFFCIRQTVCL